MAVLTPDGLQRKTFREILKDNNSDEDANEVKIGETIYNIVVMESYYNEDIQISAKEGDIVVYDLITYGYGEAISWDNLISVKEKLEAWMNDTCKKHNCTGEIRVSANYW
jgi:hypothetical protein